MQHFQQFTASLKELESEKSAKSEAKILAQQQAADAATEEAARAARFAEQQMTEADLQRSQAAINRVQAGGEVLQNAIDMIKTVDTRARGKAAITQEEKELTDERTEKKNKAEALAASLKEKGEKRALATKEQAQKTATAIKEQKTKRILKEKKDAHDAIHDEGYQKGLAHAQQVFQEAQKAQARAAATEAARSQAEGVESKAKALLKAADGVKSPSLSPVQQRAAKLVKTAVDKGTGHGSMAKTVEDANEKLTSHMQDTGGVHAEKTAKKAQLGINSAAAATGEIGTVQAKKDVQDAAKKVAHQHASDQAGKEAIEAVKKADIANAKDAAKPIQLSSTERVHFNAVRDTLNEAISDAQKGSESEEDIEDATHNALMELTDEEDDDDDE